MKKYEKGIKKMNPFTGKEEQRSEYSDEHQDEDQVTQLKDKDIEDMSDDIKTQLEGVSTKHKVDLDDDENEIVLESETDEDST